jgi:hypothetical protein
MVLAVAAFGRGEGGIVECREYLGIRASVDSHHVRRQLRSDQPIQRRVRFFPPFHRILIS